MRRKSWAVIEGNAESKYLIAPTFETSEEKDNFLNALDERAEAADEFVTGLLIDYDGSTEDGMARYDLLTGELKINAWHPFVATFYEDFTGKKSRQPLELLAMAEVLMEAHLHAIGTKLSDIEDFIYLRDQLLRNLANDSGRQSAHGVALSLQEARNSPSGLEEKVCNAFRSLGFDTTPLGKSSDPDGVATALLSADVDGIPRRYKVSLEAKSKTKDEGKVAASTVDIAAVIRHRKKYDCQHALVVGRDFPTTKEGNALEVDIASDRENTAKKDPKSITLITIDDLAKLVQLRPIKQLTLGKLRELFIQCGTPQESAAWVKSISEIKIAKPPYRAVVETIELLQKKLHQISIDYGALLVELTHLSEPIAFESKEELVNLCKGMAQMAPSALFATSNFVELDQSAENIIEIIEAAMKEYPGEE